jgi:hypothetical protein
VYDMHLCSFQSSVLSFQFRNRGLTTDS